jgi:integrase
MQGLHQLMARLLYGGGLRLMECLRVRVKDIDFEQSQVEAVNAPTSVSSAVAASICPDLISTSYSNSRR